MNAKKCKLLRKVARSIPNLPERRLVVGKKTMKRVWIELSYKQAKAASDELQALIDRDLVDGSADAIRRDALADVMKQYMDRLREDYADELIAQGEHEDHKPIRVQTVTARITAMNDPKTVRGLYLSSKRMIARLQRKLGYQKVGVSA